MAPQEIPISQPLKRAVTLVRLSPSLDAGSREDALKQHDLAFRRFCARLGAEPVATYVEGIAAGMNGNGHAASAYLRLRADLSRGQPGAIVAVARPEGLGEDPDERALAVLEIESLGATVFTLSGQAIDSASVLNGTWPRPAKAGAPAGEKIRAAMRTRAIKGEGLGKPPYGYRIGPARKLEVVPDEARVVQLIYSLYSQKGMGIRLIVKHLNEHGMVTRKGRNWSMVTIRDILRNRAYLGTYTRFGMRVPGNHAAIVSPEVFRWTQAKLEERQPTRNDVQAEPFVLSTMAYCGSCGNRMMGVTRRQSWTRKDGSKGSKEYRYYQCQSRTNQGVCTYHTRNAHELESDVLRFLVEERARIAGLKGRRATGPSPTALLKERKRLETAEAKIAQRIKRAIQRVRDGKLSLTKFRGLSAELLPERRAALDRLEVLSSPDGGAATPVQAALAAIDELQGMWGELDHIRKRDLLSSTIERITVQEHAVDVLLRSDLLP